MFVLSGWFDETVLRELPPNVASVAHKQDLNNEDIFLWLTDHSSIDLRPPRIPSQILLMMHHEMVGYLNSARNADLIASDDKMAKT